MIFFNQGLLPVKSVIANSDYMDSWHTFWTSILLLGLFLYETSLSGVHHGDVHVTHGWGKLMESARRDLGWRGQICESLLGGTFGNEGSE